MTACHVAGVLFPLSLKAGGTNNPGRMNATTAMAGARLRAGHRVTEVFNFGIICTCSGLITAVECVWKDDALFAG